MKLHYFCACKKAPKWSAVDVVRAGDASAVQCQQASRHAAVQACRVTPSCSQSGPVHQDSRPLSTPVAARRERICGYEHERESKSSARGCKTLLLHHKTIFICPCSLRNSFSCPYSLLSSSSSSEFCDYRALSPGGASYRLGFNFLLVVLFLATDAERRIFVLHLAIYI